VTVNNATSWQTPTLDPAGVILLNGLLTDLLTELKTGTPASNTTITYHVHGDSTPADVATDFVWEIKANLTIKGNVKVTVLE
jgi:hypothetical protein